MTPEREAYLRDLIERAEYSFAAYETVNEGKRSVAFIDSINESIKDNGGSHSQD